MNRLRIIAVAAALLVISAVMAWRFARPSSEESNVRAATRVVESIQHGSPLGFDPDAWEAATDQNTVVPRGGRLEALPGSWVIQGNSASVDVKLIQPNERDRRYWLLLHRVRSEWLVYGSLELESSRG